MLNPEFPFKKKKRTNKISIHFQENQNHTAEDMDIQIIDKLLTIPKDPKELTLKLKRVEGFWQAHLRTVGENGLNSVDELFCLVDRLLSQGYRALRSLSKHFMADIRISLRNTRG